MPARIFFALLSVTALACGGQEPDPGALGDDLEAGGSAHALPLSAPGDAPAAPAGKLDYYGGRVLANAEIVNVRWGSDVAPEVRDGMAGFYGALAGSSYLGWLSEYDTTRTAAGGGPGTQQRIGKATLSGDVTLQPRAHRSVVTDAAVQRELAAQIASGKLPAPKTDTVYMVSFPAGVAIDLGGARSCQQGGFCGYHGTFKRRGRPVAYAVLPDLGPGSGCEGGCGGGATVFDNQTSVASHELVEAITDADVGLAGGGLGPPLAWYDARGGEIGDLCNGKQARLRTRQGKSYVVQKEWSNRAHACIAQRGGPADLVEAD